MSLRRSFTHLGPLTARTCRPTAIPAFDPVRSLRRLQFRLLSTVRPSSLSPSRNMSEPVEGKGTEAAAGKSSKRDKRAAKVDKTATATAAVDVPAAAEVAPGALKDFSGKMADAYNIRAVESHWDAWWDAQGLYRPLSDEQQDTTAESFVIVIPPPNVTGTLHLGHALTCSVEDAIVRYQRMRGRNVLWLPGTDHAGIATQVVVEKKIRREQQLSRHEMGREAFIEEVWKWKHANGNRINQQIRRLGASVDWSREAFTMDENLSRAVQHAFITLRQRRDRQTPDTAPEPYIVRANRIVSWSCALKSAISAIEVEHVDLPGSTLVRVPGYDEPVEFGVIHSFVYKVRDGDPDEQIIVATTRIETMLGDVAVAVHPKDERYKHLHGKLLVHPFIPEREVRVVTDDKLVKMEFGTGAVKVTPAHDPLDFACGERCGLPVINIFTDDGLVNDNGGVFKGMKRFDARRAVIEELNKLGLYVGKEDNKMALGMCSRSKDVVEPVVRPQWWVKCGALADAALKKVESKELIIIPEEKEKEWKNWLKPDSIQDWCISRQLWWGHRIPAYHVSVPSDPSFASHSDKDDDFWVVGKSSAEALLAAQAKWPHIPKNAFALKQDEDVLDTWFSSGLFPFSTMGWPLQTPDLARFYPGTLLETGHDILFFWVARMVMMGLELTGTLPFTTVYLHAMVRDKQGKKMSKSLGNVVDPLDVIDGITLEQLNSKLLQGNLDPREVARATQGQRESFPDGIASCGADALRFGLLAYSSQGSNVNLDIQRVVAYSHFGNKLWQATRFALLKFDKDFQKPQSLADVQRSVKAGGFSTRFIMSRLAAAVQRANTGFADYQFAEVTTAVYNFWLYELCDVYLELIKPMFPFGEQSTEAPIDPSPARESALAVLYTCLRSGLLLLHPLMPFISEELWHRLPGAMTTEEQKTGTGGRKHCGSIMVERYPTVEEFSLFVDPEIEQLHSVLEELGKSARSTRSNLGLLPKQRQDIYVLCSDAHTVAQLEPHTRDIGTLAMAKSVTVLEQRPTVNCSSSVVSPAIELLTSLEGVDFTAELVKMEKQLDSLNDSIRQLKDKMAAVGYEKSKDEVRARNTDKLAADEGERQKLEASIANFQGFMTAEDRDRYQRAKVAIKVADRERVKIGMEKIVPAGGDASKLNKKIAGKYAELKKEYDQLVADIEKLELQQPRS